MRAACSRCARGGRGGLCGQRRGHGRVLDAERSACQARMHWPVPEFQALQYRLQGASNGNKATPAEAGSDGGISPRTISGRVRRSTSRSRGRTHPSLAPLYNAAAAQADANIARLATYQISWGQYVRNGRTIRIDLNGRLAAAKVALQLPSLNGLDLAAELEPGPRILAYGAVAGLNFWTRFALSTSPV